MLLQRGNAPYCNMNHPAINRFSSFLSKLLDWMVHFSDNLITKIFNSKSYVTRTSYSRN